MNNPKPHSRRLRTGRWSEAGQIYLLTSATWQRRPVFADQALGRVVVAAMAHYEAAGQVDSLAFVVMPEHFHWLVSLGAGMTLAKLMGGLKGYTLRRIMPLVRARYPQDPLWQEGYHDHALRQDEDVCQAATYVVANPLRAGLVQNLADYPLWGSQWPPEFDHLSPVGAASKPR